MDKNIKDFTKNGVGNYTIHFAKPYRANLFQRLIYHLNKIKNHIISLLNNKE